MNNAIPVDNAFQLADVLQLGAVGVIFLFAVKEFFSYLKSKNNAGSGNGGVLNTAILAELRTMNTNHLHSIQQAIEQGNKDTVEAITRGNMQMVELLGEIKGQLYK